jgi:septum formation protein
MDEELILASVSPARAGLLAAAGLNFSIEPADIDEAAVRQSYGATGRDVGDCALVLAEAKARWVSQLHDQALVIGADQILVCDDAWFEKPGAAAQACAQLRALRGRTHRLVTAACAVRAGQHLWHAVTVPKLSMRPFSDSFLQAYLAAEGPAILGTVGAYRLEGRGIQLFDRIEGDYFSILGLPLLELLAFLRDRGTLVS